MIIGRSETAYRVWSRARAPAATQASMFSSTLHIDDGSPANAAECVEADAMLAREDNRRFAPATIDLKNLIDAIPGDRIEATLHKVQMFLATIAATREQIPVASAQRKPRLVLRPRRKA
jgi:hypothetical protein